VTLMSGGSNDGKGRLVAPTTTLRHGGAPGPTWGGRKQVKGASHGEPR
jgi:hypothetical protein